LSCNESEEEISLGNNFYYIPFQETTFDVTTFGGNGIYKIDNYKKVPVILPDIEEYKYNTDFIIAKQNFDIEQTSRLIENMIFMPNVYFKFDKRSFKLDENYLAKLDESKRNSIYYEEFTKQLLENTQGIQRMKSNKENYYIIEKKNFKVNGPFTIKEFRKANQNLKTNLNFE
jgi:hypothetical protein